MLVAASYVFYASWNLTYAGLVFGLVVLNYAFKLILARAASRLLLLWIFISFDLAVLALFKYWNFGATTLSTGLQVLGYDTQVPLSHLILPLGISFFTFEFIHYLVDIYRGHVPIHHFSSFHTFCS